MRPQVRTNRWLGIVSRLALAVAVLLSPTRVPQTPTARVCEHFLYRNSALVSNVFGLALASAAPDQASFDADKSDSNEEEERESFGSSSHLICPPFLPSNSSPKLLSGPHLGGSPPWTVALALRC